MRSLYSTSLSKIYGPGPGVEFKVVPRGGVNTFLACGLAIDGMRGQVVCEECCMV